MKIKKTLKSGTLNENWWKGIRLKLNKIKKHSNDGIRRQIENKKKDLEATIKQKESSCILKFLKF